MTTYVDDKKVRNEIKGIKAIIDNTLKGYIKSAENNITLSNKNEKKDELNIFFLKIAESDAMKALMSLAEIHDQLIMIDNKITKEKNDIKENLTILEYEKGYIKQIMHDLKRNEGLLTYIADQNNILNIVKDLITIPKLLLKDNLLVNNEIVDISRNDEYNGIYILFCLIEN